MNTTVRTNDSTRRLAHAARVLERHAALADERGCPKFARVFWQKRAEATSRLKTTALMKNTGARLW